MLETLWQDVRYGVRVLIKSPGFTSVAVIALALWGVKALGALMPDRLIPLAGGVSLDHRVLGFTLATTIFTGLACMLAPALQAARVDVHHSLKQGAGRGVAGTARTRLRSALVVAEVALALVLLIGAALLLRTFANLRQVAPGFDSRNVLTFQVAPSGEQYDTTTEHAEYFRRALERIKSLPGVEAAAVTSNLPLGAWLNQGVEVEGRPETQRSTEVRLVTPDYFRVMKMAVRQGREFEDSDGAGSEPVAIISEAYARQTP